MRRVAVAVAGLGVALSLAGCAGGSGGLPDDAVTGPSAASGTPGPRPSPAGTVAADLTVALDATGGGTVATMTLTCAPAGGDHPDPAAACAALERPGAIEAFAPVPRDVACTELFGGPQTATVTGTVDGDRVDADFSRVNGCEIARWDALAALLGSPGGV